MAIQDDRDADAESRRQLANEGIDFQRPAWEQVVNDREAVSADLYRESETVAYRMAEALDWDGWMETDAGNYYEIRTVTSTGPERRRTDDKGRLVTDVNGDPVIDRDVTYPYQVLCRRIQVADEVLKHHFGRAAEHKYTYAYAVLGPVWDGSQPPKRGGMLTQESNDAGLYIAGVTEREAFGADKAELDQVLNTIVRTNQLGQAMKNLDRGTKGPGSADGRGL